MRVFEGFCQDVICNTDLILEIEEAPQRLTGSGLYRVDEGDFGNSLHHLTGLIELKLAMRLHSQWAMVLEPSAGDVLLHAHNNWRTAIYYPATHPSALLLDGFQHLPRKGDLVALEPGELHGVAPNNTEVARYSVVLIYNEDYAT